MSEKTFDNNPLYRKGSQDPMKDLLAKAHEAEIEKNRHTMEAAVLATVHRYGADAPALWNSFLSLELSRTDHTAIAEALKACGMIPQRDLLVISAEISGNGANVDEAVLKEVLCGNNVKAPEDAIRFIEIMEHQDRIRRAGEVCRSLQIEIDSLNDEEDLDEAFARLLKTTFNLAHGKRLIREFPVEAEDAAEFLNTLEARRNDKRDFLGLNSGFKHLDEVFNGLTEGVFILSGAPSTGKTTLAKQIADHVAEAEKTPVLFWSFEQSKEELRIKSLARISSVDARSIWKGRTADQNWNQIVQAERKYREGPGRWLTIIEAGRDDTLDRIRNVALMAKHRAGDKQILLIIDYLQIIPPGKDAPESLREKVDWNLSELRRLSRDLKSPVLVISSQNREAYKGNKAPTLAALKESGGIEYSADGVLCLWRDKKESETLTKKFSRSTIRVNAYVLKNRNGELAMVALDFTPSWAMFTERDKSVLAWPDALGGE